MKIYVAGPYTANSETLTYQNVLTAIDVGLSLWKKGHHPYIPHPTHFVDSRAKQTGIAMTWAEYIEWDSVWVEACDALLFLGGSKGADKELHQAKTLGKIIFYTIEEVPNIARRGHEHFD